MLTSRTSKFPKIIKIVLVLLNIEISTIFSYNDSIIDWEQQIKAVFNQVAHHSTTKRSVPYDVFDPKTNRHDYHPVFRPYESPSNAYYPPVVTTSSPSLDDNIYNRDRDRDRDRDETRIKVGQDRDTGTFSGAKHPLQTSVSQSNNHFRANNLPPLPTNTLLPPTDDMFSMPSLSIADNESVSKEKSIVNESSDTYLSTKSNQKSLYDDIFHVNVDEDEVPSSQPGQNEMHFEYGPVNEVTSGIGRILGDSNNRQENLSKFLSNIAEKQQPTLPTIMTTTQSTTTTITTSTTIMTTSTTTTTRPRTRTKTKITTAYQSVTQQTTHIPPVHLHQSNDSVVAISPSYTSSPTTSDKVWFILWNVHIYLIVIGNLLQLMFSLYKLITFNEKEQLLFHKKHFISVHGLIMTITLMRLFYLTYDSYNINKSLPFVMQDLLNHMPLSLLAITFALLVIVLVKRSLSHLRVTKPIFLVFFGLLQSALCLLLIVMKNAIRVATMKMMADLVCRFIFILLCCSLGFSYLYLYRIIRNVLTSKKAANFSELIAQNICYAAHLTIAVALLFLLLGLVQLYGLFAVRNDNFDNNYYWILWAFELSLRLLEIFIMVLIAVIISLRIEQRTNGATTASVTHGTFPMLTCPSASASVSATNTTSDSSTDHTCAPIHDFSLRRSLRHAQHSDIYESLPTSTPIKMAAPNISQHQQPTEFYKKPHFANSNHNNNNNNVYSEPGLDTNAIERGSRVRVSSQSGSSAMTSSSSSMSRKSNRRQRTAAPGSSFNYGFGVGVAVGGGPAMCTLPSSLIEKPVDNNSATMLVDDNGFVRFKHLNDSPMTYNHQHQHQHHHHDSNKMASTLGFGRKINRNFNEC